MASPRYSVKVPEESLPALRRLLALGPTDINQLTSALRDSGPSLDHFSLRAVAVCDRLGRPELAGDVEDILRDIVFPLRRTIQKYGISSDDIISALDQNIKSEAAAPEGGLAAFTHADRGLWDECKDAINRLISSDMMAMEAKGEALLEARSNVALGLNVYSDIRPLFDDRGEHVRARILTNTLRVRYLVGGRPREESFSLDPADLVDLKNQVERALRKNAALARTEGSDIPILIVRTAEHQTGEHQ